MREIKDTVQYEFATDIFVSAPLVVTYPHTSLLCTPFSAYNRLKVQQGDYAFDDGRVWRAFYKFSIPTGTSAYLKVVVDAPIHLRKIHLNLISSEILLSTIAGGAEGTAFTVPVPALNRNNIPDTPVHLPDITMTAGGTQSGGLVIDQIWGKSGNNANFSMGISADDEDKRGIAAGTYFYRLENTDGATANGILSAGWETL